MSTPAAQINERLAVLKREELAASRAAALAARRDAARQARIDAGLDQVRQLAAKLGPQPEAAGAWGRRAELVACWFELVARGVRAWPYATVDEVSQRLLNHLPETLRPVLAEVLADRAMRDLQRDHKPDRWHECQTCGTAHPCRPIFAIRLARQPGPFVGEW